MPSLINGSNASIFYFLGSCCIGTWHCQDLDSNRQALDYICTFLNRMERMKKDDIGKEKQQASSEPSYN
jgi:hypothetical protein